MNKFVLEVSNLINEECHTAMLVRVTEISQVMIYVEHIKGLELKKRKKGETKSAHFQGSFKGAKGGGNSLFQQGHKFQGQGSSSAPRQMFINGKFSNHKAQEINDGPTFLGA